MSELMAAQDSQEYSDAQGFLHGGGHFELEQFIPRAGEPWIKIPTHTPPTSYTPMHILAMPPPPKNWRITSKICLDPNKLGDSWSHLNSLTSLHILIISCSIPTPLVCEVMAWMLQG